MTKTKYDHVQTLAWVLTGADMPWSIQRLALPEEWRQLLNRLWTEIKRDIEDDAEIADETEMYPFPVTSLNATLRATMSDLVSIRKGVASPPRPGDSSNQWLLSHEPIDPELLALVVKEWARVTFKHASVTSHHHLVDRLDSSDLRWKPETVNLAQYGTAPNGTADPSQLHFSLLPDWIANRLTQPDVVLQLGERPLRFCRCASPEDGGAEIISWEPLRYGDDWPFSVLLTFTVQTVPFQPYPVIHCDVGIRRWAGRKVTWTGTAGDATTVYLRSKVGWLPGKHRDCFVTASMKWYQGGMAWSDHLAEILDHLTPLQPKYPSAQGLLDEPAFWLNFGNPIAAVVFDQGMHFENGDNGTGHEVEAGISVFDRYRIADQIVPYLKPYLDFAPELARAPQVRCTKSNRLFQKDWAHPRDDKEAVSFGKAMEEEMMPRQNAIAAALDSSPLTVELWTQDEKGEIAREMKAIVAGNLGEGRDSSIRYRTRSLGAIGRELEVKSRERYASGADVRVAIEQRVREIEGSLSPSTNPTLAIIEIQPRHEFDPRKHTDPKSALRIGAAGRGCHSQFITTSTKVVAERCFSALRDGLRQLGVVGELPTVASAEFPAPVHYVGIWLANMQRRGSPTLKAVRVPIAVHLRSDGQGGIRVKVPGFNRWYDYREAQLLLATDQYHNLVGEKGKKETTVTVASFVRELLSQDLRALNEPVLLMVNAHNLRGRHAWSWLQNPQITQDRIAFGAEEPVPVSENWPNLRIARIRGADRHETPEWYAEDADEEMQGNSTGLWVIGDRVFASTAQKPAQFRRFIDRSSKISAWTDRNGRSYEPRPFRYAWNPVLYEITLPCLQPGDHPVAWATLVHRLRDTAIQFNEATALPLPLHLAQKIEEYVLPRNPKPLAGERAH
ncbi:MAG: DUF3962 domain-containing protein [Chloroflexi bacterium]|nr:DUF3962 domain-containing protein [Chloroflexota bacterium]